MLHNFKFSLEKLNDNDNINIIAYVRYTYDESQSRIRRSSRQPNEQNELIWQ